MHKYLKIKYHQLEHSVINMHEPIYFYLYFNFEFMVFWVVMLSGLVGGYKIFRGT